MHRYIKKGYSVLTSREFVVFFVGGVTAFLLDFSILQFEILVLHYNATLFNFIFIPNLISTGIAIFYAFAFQKFIAFREKEGKVYEQFAKHVSLQGANLIVFNTILFGIFLSFGLSVTFSKIIVTGIQTFWSFFAYKFFVFKKKSK
jgi:putative flippase GtrA